MNFKKVMSKFVTIINTQYIQNEVRKLLKNVFKGKNFNTYTINYKN